MNIVITGASNGIGYQTALLLAQQGHRVFSIARSKENLERLKTDARERNPNSRIVPLAGDITSSDFLAEIEKEILKVTGNVDVLINNAGKLLNKSFSALSLSDWEGVYRVNV